MFLNGTEVYPEDEESKEDLELLRVPSTKTTPTTTAHSDDYEESASADDVLSVP